MQVHMHMFVCTYIRIICVFLRCVCVCVCVCNRKPGQVSRQLFRCLLLRIYHSIEEIAEHHIALQQDAFAVGVESMRCWWR